MKQRIAPFFLAGIAALALLASLGCTEQDDATAVPTGAAVVIAASQTPSPAPTATATPVPYQVVITSFGALLRDRPNGAISSGRIPNGTVVDVLGRDEQGTWLLVRLPDGPVGWLDAARETDVTAAIDDAYPIAQTVPATGTSRPPATPQPLATPGPATPTTNGPSGGPTLPPITAAQAGDAPEAYRLRAWSGAAAAALVAQMTDYAELIKADNQLYAYYADRGRREILAAGQEFILRYPDSPHRTAVEWQMVDASTYTGGGYDDVLAALIAADLNAGLVTPETLDAYLGGHGLQLGQKDCQNCDPFPATIANLLGDGREILLFLVQREPRNIEGGLLLAIWQEADGRFVVRPITSQWAAESHFSGAITGFEARHITGSAQPELVVTKYGHSGSIIRSNLDVFRWDGAGFVRLAGFYFSGGPFGEVWEFVDDANPSRLQVTDNYNQRTTIYEWTGASYQAIAAMESATPPEADALFALNWVQEGIAAGHYAAVIDYLEEALSGSDSLGQHYRRTLQFLLGMNYVYLEDEAMARAVFTALRDEPAPPEFSAYGQAAAAFLTQYTGRDSAYEACRAAYAVLRGAEEVLAAVTDVPLCAFDQLLADKLARFDGAGNILDYVAAEDIFYAQQHDLDGAAGLDWLLALSPPALRATAAVEVWAVLPAGGQSDVVPLTTIYRGEITSFAAASHSFPFLDTPLIAILAGDNFGSGAYFSVLQLVQVNGEWQATNRAVNNTATGYDLQLIDGNLQLDVLVDASVSYMQVDQITYHWDPGTATFAVVSQHAPNSLGLPFNDALDRAESLIFADRDFAAAIPILATIVNDVDSDDDYFWRYSFPKTLYLLGLAHELAGNEAAAVAAYWQLWRDYPTDPYALMAAAKLVAQ